MTASYQTQYWIEGSYFPPLALYDFIYFRTRFTSQMTQHSPIHLPSLTEPLTFVIAGAFVMACSALLAVGIFSASTTAARDKFGASVLVISATVNQASVVHINSKQARIYALWILSIGFMSGFYTNLLQSAVVAPSLRQLGMSFDEMVDRKFKFVASSTVFGYIRAMGEHEKFYTADNVPAWWNFAGTRSGDLLAETLERMKAAGFVGYLLHYAEYYRMTQFDILLRTVKKEIEHGNEFPPVALSDSLVSESLVMYINGYILTCIFFLCETLWSRVGLRWVVAVLRYRGKTVVSKFEESQPCEGGVKPL